MQFATQADKIRYIQALKNILERELEKRCFLFMHYQGVIRLVPSKTKVNLLFSKNIRKSKILCRCASLFGSFKDVTDKHLFEIGCKHIVSLNGGNIDLSNLNVFHYELYIRKIVSARTGFYISRLAYTQNAL